jgi:hypothetical protein
LLVREDSCGIGADTGKTRYGQNSAGCTEVWGVTHTYTHAHTHADLEPVDEWLPVLLLAPQELAVVLILEDEADRVGAQVPAVVVSLVACGVHLNWLI